MINKSVEKKIKRRKKAFKSTFFILILFFLVYTILSSKLFNVNNIIVENNYFVTTEEIKLLAAIQGKNIFTINQNKVESNIKYNPYVEKIKLSRKFPNTIELQIREKRIIGMIKFDNGFIQIDDQGKMVQMVTKFPDGKIPIIEGVTTVKFDHEIPITKDVNKMEAIKSIALIFDFVEYDGLIKSINIADPLSISFVTKDENTVFLGSSNDMEYKLTLAYNILRSDEVKEQKHFIYINSDGSASIQKQ